MADNGLLKGCVFIGRCLSPQEIQAMYEDQKGAFEDLSGNGNHGTLKTAE